MCICFVVAPSMPSVCDRKESIYLPKKVTFLGVYSWVKNSKTNDTNSRFTKIL